MSSAVKALVETATGAVSAFFRGPKPIYDPTVHTMRGWQKKFKAVWNAEGFGTAYNNLRMTSVMRTGGVLMGTDHLGQRYYENKEAPYGRTRWMECPTPGGVWAIEDKYDGAMIPPEWHGWMTYMHDMPGHLVNKRFAKPFRTPWVGNQTYQRKEFFPEMVRGEEGFHKPPGQWSQNTPRGRIGPKYASWDPNGSGAPPKLRNFADNSQHLSIE